MKRPTKGILFIVLGIVLAVVVGLFANNAVSKAMEETKVVVAKETIQPFTQISAKDLQVTTMPASAVTEGTAHSIEQINGMYTKTMIPKGNTIQKDQIVTVGDSDLSSVLTGFGEPDIRAFALPTENPMIKRINPGNKVDLYAETDGEEPSFLIAENVHVLGIARSDDKPVGLILALNNEQIENIVPVMNNIQISLVPFNAETKSEEGGDDSVDGNGNKD